MYKRQHQGIVGGEIAGYPQLGKDFLRRTGKERQEHHAQHPDAFQQVIQHRLQPVSYTHLGPHKIQGIGAGFVPATLDRTVLDDVLTVTNEDAFAAGRAVAKEEGILRCV